MKIYKCHVCGNVIDLLDDKKGELKCCDEKMVLIKENDTDGVKEKHVPSYKIEDGMLKIVVGEVKHVMEEEHFIEFITYVYKENVFRKNLKPKDEPEASFPYLGDGVIYEYCNKHGLWKKDMTS